MGWNINFNGMTKLKDWWGVVRDNFIYLKELIAEVDKSIGMRIAEARGINPTKHIVESAENKSGWFITDHYLVPVPTTDGKVAYEEYAYVDGAWQVIGNTMEADLSGYYNKTQINVLMSDKALIVCGVYSVLDYSEYTQTATNSYGKEYEYTVKEAFINLGFTPDMVEVHHSNGAMYATASPGEASYDDQYYGGIAFTDLDSTMQLRLGGSNGFDVSVKNIEIVTNGFIVRSAKSDSNDTGALGTRRFKAYKNCEYVTITGSGTDSE